MKIGRDHGKAGRHPEERKDRAMDWGDRKVEEKAVWERKGTSKKWAVGIGRTVRRVQESKV